MQVELGGKRALITGATGFIGGRLAETLACKHDVRVRGLVRNFTRAPRLARLDAELVPGDAAVEADVKRAAAGCDLIFHCAYGNSGDQDAQRRGTLDSTRHVLEAALENGARVVNVSTVAVYGATADGDLTEESPRPGGGDVYSDSKLAAEALCRRYAEERGLPVATVQPTIVYGPFGPAWTLRILGDLSRWRVILVDGGRGLCNAVYVDDVVQAMLLAAVRDQAVGKEFLVSGPAPVTWKEFIGRHEALLGEECTVSLDFDDALARFREARRLPGLVENTLAFLRTDEYRWRIGHTLESSPLVRAALNATPAALKESVKQLVVGRRSAELTGGTAQGGAAAGPGASDKPIQLMPEGVLTMLRARTRVRIDRARRELGYEPRFDFDSGFERTAAWARWAGLAPQAEPAGNGASQEAAG